MAEKCEKSDECFWWKVKNDVNYNIEHIIENSFKVNANRKCPCESFSNFMQVFRCRECKSTIDGHNNFLHDELCDACWDKMVDEENEKLRESKKNQI